MDWIYKDNIVDNLPMNTFGFTYLLTFTDGSLYVGRKNHYSTVKKYLTKKELALRTDMRTATYKYVTRESDWRKYTGSSKETEGKVLVSKEILNFYPDRINLTYAEIEEMIKRDVLRDDRYLNGNCLGKFYRGKIL